MSTDNIAINLGEQAENDLDATFDVLAHSYRRTIIEELERDAPLEVTELAERIATRQGTTSARHVEIELVHQHVPRLADADIIEYDTGTGRCDLDRAEMVRSVLDVVHSVT